MSSELLVQLLVVVPILSFLLGIIVFIIKNRGSVKTEPELPLTAEGCSYSESRSSSLPNDSWYLASDNIER